MIRRHEPRNVCDACDEHVEGDRYVLESAGEHTFWACADSHVEQEHRLVACSVECAFELLGLTPIGGRA